MRILSILVCAALLWGSAWAQAMPEPKRPPISSPQQQQQQQLQRILLRLATRALDMDARRATLEGLRHILTPEQSAAISKLRLTPEQAVALVDLLQETLPQILTNREGTDAILRQTVLPRALTIVGPEQLDLVLQLTPTPEQQDQVRRLLESTPRLEPAQLVGIATEFLREARSISTPRQTRWLDILEGVLRR